MSKNRVVQPNFKWSFLLPQYWLVWIAVFIQVAVSWLPYSWQLLLGRAFGSLLFRLNLKRAKVALINLRLCFPDKQESELNSLLKKNMQHTATALLEVGMGWWWPNWRVKKHVKVIGEQYLADAQEIGKGTLLLSLHNLSVEINCRGVGYTHPTVVFYRPYNNALVEYFQYRGRMHANKYMLGKHDIKGLMKALRNGETCVYLPDQDYGRKRSLFVPFLGVKDTPTTNTTLVLSRQKNTQTCFAIPIRNEDGSGYTIEISPPLENFPSGDDEKDVTLINQLIENAVKRHPEQYMWLHRRFKTRPNEDDESLYK